MFPRTFRADGAPLFPSFLNAFAEGQLHKFMNNGPLVSDRRERKGKVEGRNVAARRHSYWKYSVSNYKFKILCFLAVNPWLNGNQLTRHVYEANSCSSGSFFFSAKYMCVNWFLFVFYIKKWWSRISKNKNFFRIF